MAIPRPYGPQQHAVYVSFIGPKGRERKRFENAYEARRFYAKKLKDGKEPKVERAEP
jgi:hypothetical protein